MKRFNQKNFLLYAIWLLMSSIFLGACGQLQSDLPMTLPPSPRVNDLTPSEMDPIVISDSNFSVDSAKSASQKDIKVSLCHNTGSQGNPFVFMTVSQNGGMNGHNNHPGDIFNVSSPGDCAQTGEPSDPAGTEIPAPTATTAPPANPNPTATPSPTPQYKPTNICHATGDPSQPYEFIAISDDTTYLLHLIHTGDIFDVNSSADCPTTTQTILADEPIGNLTPAPKKVAICHVTGSEVNPYVLIFVKNNDNLSGHKGHEYDLFDVSETEECPTSLQVETEVSPED